MIKRLGFVSNSSSSSFVLITSKENHDKVYNELHPYCQAVIDNMFKHEYCFTNNFMGKEVVIFAVADGDYSWTDDFSDPEYDGEKPKSKYGGTFNAYDAFHQYREEVGKNLDEVIITGVEC
jgi:hypothetical protein